MFYQVLSKSLHHSNDVITPSYQKLVFKDVSDNGMLMRTSVFEEFNIAEQLNKFTFNDFKLSSILSVGATDMLRPCYLALNTGLASADAVERSLKDIANAAKVVIE